MTSAPPGYTVRARTYAAEIAAGATTPRLLGHLLRFGMSVAEIPSGTGHYIRAYAAAGCRTILVDASTQMLTAAAATTTGRADVSLVHARLETLTAADLMVDLTVMPNGALNQLAHDLPLPDIFRPLAGVLNPGGHVLVQALLGEPAEACGFYEPSRGSVWFTDRRLPDPATGDTLVRRRRQRGHDDVVSIDFALHRDEALVYEQTVAIRLLNRVSLTAAAALAGLTVTMYRPGLGHLTEVVLTGASS